MPRLASLPVALNSVNPPGVPPAPQAHPMARRRPKTSLRLRVFAKTDDGGHRPISGATVIITDARQVTVGGQTDSSGWVDLRTGFAVLRVGRLDLYVQEPSGIRNYSLDAPQLIGMRCEPSVACNSTIIAVSA
jgi:hypothetical protein